MAFLYAGPSAIGSKRDATSITSAPAATSHEVAKLSPSDQDFAKHGNYGFRPLWRRASKTPAIRLISDSHLDPVN